MNRLEYLAFLCHGSSSVLDVGCDHAYVLIEAIKKYGVNHGIASDISDGPLSIAKKNIINNNLIDKIEIVKSNGFENITSSFDTAIIAGMGGILISNILEQGKAKINGKKLILEPNSDQNIVRRKLMELGFEIVFEDAIIDQNKYHEIIVAKPGNVKYTKLELDFGPILLKNKPEVFVKKYEALVNKLKNIIPNINDSGSKNIKIEELANIENMLKGI